VRLLLDTHIHCSMGRGRRSETVTQGAQEALGYFRDAGYELLDISPADVVAIETISTVHADPIDRILVAQALAVPLRLLTHDPIVARYSDLIIHV
jgi:PIN domain nuclease of toxin-antitoxin system